MRRPASDPIINGIKLAREAGRRQGRRLQDRDPASRSSTTTRSTACTTRRPGATTWASSSAIAKVVGVIGPLNSNVATAQIPITNAAGLAQCSPGEHEPGPDQGRVRRARRSRGQAESTTSASSPRTTSRARPRRSTSTRTSASRSVYIIDDTETFGKGIADNFEAHFKETLGGTVVERRRRAEDHARLRLDPDRGCGQEPGGIYFGGVTASGGARILQAAVTGRPRRHPVRWSRRHQRRRPARPRTRS